MKMQQSAWLKKILLYPVRTTLAAVLGFVAARGIGSPQVYWATISAIIVVQSDFKSSLKTSWQRFAGTVLGSFLGALLAVTLGTHLAAYAIGIFAVGILSAALRLDLAAIRFAGIALTIVMLVAHSESTWNMALDRCLEVSVGILAGLVVSAIWPEQPNNGSR